MSWQDELVERLAATPCCGYRRDDEAATEPTALAGLALLGCGQDAAARQTADWLADCQSAAGSVGVRAGEPQPRWPTSLAVLTWQAAQSITESNEAYQDCIDRAVQWIINMRGKSQPRTPAAGHDPTLVAWPWVEGTHSWIEPTALHLLALKASGHAHHDRAREAIHLLLDRQLPRGGCNYGNTVILGQRLRPHVQPTGLAMLALAGQQDPLSRIDKSLGYLRRSLSMQTTTTSLCWGLLGLAAHRRTPQQAERWLEAAYGRATRRDSSPHQLALLVLAALADRSPLVTLLALASPENVS